MSTLDTSGRVECNDPSKPCICHTATWDRITLFPQGYVEAALKSLRAKWTETPHVPFQGPAARVEIERIGFRHLAPETLAAMLKDCERFAAAMKPYADPRTMGEQFWTVRQRGGWSDFPPLTLYLGDDGKISQRERA